MADSVTVPVWEGEGDGVLLGVPGGVGQHRAEVRGGVREDEKMRRHRLPIAADQPEVDKVAGGEEGEKGGGDPSPPLWERRQGVRRWRMLLVDLNMFW